MRFSRTIAVFLFSFLFSPAFAAAETVFVSDQLVITFRQGKSTEHKILKTLKTGTPMEVLERVEGDSYVKVRLESGEEGYVLAQYLTDETPKALVISRLEKQLEKIREQLARAEAKLADSSRELNAVQEMQNRKEGELTASLDELNQALTQTKEELRTVTEKHDTLLANSGKVVEIADERDRLKKVNEKLSTEVRSLTAEKTDLLRTGAIKWFLAGGGVFLLGWMIGKISRKKQRGLY